MISLNINPVLNLLLGCTKSVCFCYKSISLKPRKERQWW